MAGQAPTSVRITRTVPPGRSSAMLGYPAAAPPSPNADAFTAVRPRKLQRFEEVSHVLADGFSAAIAPAQLAGDGIRLRVDFSALRLELRELIGHHVQVGCDLRKHGRTARDRLSAP